MDDRFSAVLRHGLALSLLLVLACGGNGDSDVTDPGPTDVPADVADVPGADAEDPGPTDTPTDTPADTPTDVPPALACLGEVTGAKPVDLPGLGANVEVVRDKWGIPHIYASTEADAFRAQGFVTAMDRAAAIQAMRLILQGRFASTGGGGPSQLPSDAYMRLLDMYGVANRIWTDLQASDPALATLMQAYADGVTAAFDAMKTNKLTPPAEWPFLEPWDAWTPVDSLAMGRLQSWDLSFSHYIDEIEMATLMAGLAQKVVGTPQQGLLVDAFRAAPAAPETVLPPPPAPAVVRAAPFSAGKAPAKSYLAALRGARDALRSLPIRPGVLLGAGSNNWAIAPAHTATGKAILANDPHLALRNPAVFHLVHMDTTRAGGDLSISGSSFPGIPGVILGRNGRAAWAGTVHNYDVTDVYVETYKAGTTDTVLFDGGEVKTVTRQETFTYGKPKAGCDNALNDFVKALSPVVVDQGTTCQVTVTMESVPHHGPVIPGSKRTVDGATTALTWKWTGFEPTEDIRAVSGLWKMKTPDEFLATIARFGVGAQNWMYADVDGHIAWAPFAKVPIRKHLSVPAVDPPVPWLPMPGDGCCEWIGFIPTAELPQAVDPGEGVIMTANNDPVGNTLDNDPLDDSRYTGHTYDLGFRAARLRELLNELVVRGDMTVEDMQKLQADHQSPMGRVMTPGLLQAIQAAKEAADGGLDADPVLAALYSAEIEAATPYLQGWTFDAAAGVDVGSGVTEQQGKDAIATSIFNAWLAFLEKAIFPNKGLSELPDQFKAKLLTLLFQAPDQLATWHSKMGDSTVWDDLSTAEVTETRNQVIVKALGDALAWLADAGKVFPVSEGGFGTDDMTKWTWGTLHTLTLRSSLGGEANIPPESKWANGFPRPGDNFVVDSSNPGFSDLNFRYTNGPSQRPVYLMDLDAGAPTQNALPGGVVGAFPNKHYGDLFELWARNQYHPVHTTEAGVIGDAESCTVLRKP